MIGAPLDHVIGLAIGVGYLVLALRPWDDQGLWRRRWARGWGLRSVVAALGLVAVGWAGFVLIATAAKSRTIGLVAAAIPFFVELMLLGRHISERWRLRRAARRKRTAPRVS